MIVVTHTHPQSYTWDSVSHEIVSSKKFKWLRERMGGHSLHTTLLHQMKNFVLSDEGDVKVLLGTLKTQVSICIHVNAGYIAFLFTYVLLFTSSFSKIVQLCVLRGRGTFSRSFHRTSCFHQCDTQPYVDGWACLLPHAG